MTKSGPWLWWGYVPGVHWMAWLLAGLEARYPGYVWIGAFYALPFLSFVIGKRLSWRLLFLSWVLSLLHLQLQKRDILRRLAAVTTSVADSERLRQALLRAALKHHGYLSVTQGVLETGESFQAVEGALEDMAASGYVFKRNHPDTGVVEYVFREVL